MLIIYSDIISPRLEYVTRFIFRDVCGLEPVLKEYGKETGNFEEPAIHYTVREIEGAFRIIPAGLMETGPVYAGLKPGTIVEDDIKCLFPVKGGKLPFDIFSAVFFMISRYEEYRADVKDRYGRFPASESIAVKEDFYGLPVVNIWIEMLKASFGKKYPFVKFKDISSDYLLTVDIDNPWAHRHKGAGKLAGGLIRFILKGKFDLARERLQSFLGSETDPYDSYDLILEDTSKLKVFLLIGSKGKNDNSFSLKNIHWKEKIEFISGNAEIGLHPSFYSNTHKDALQREHKSLESIAGREIYSSRQHFLMLEFPATYRNLINEGIKEDYSMGYSELPGFRSGTSWPFNFYDIGKEEETGLKIFTFCLMDRTLKDYMGLSPDEAIKETGRLVTMVKKYGGIFIPIWHNESLGTSKEWSGWNSVYLEMQKSVKEQLTQDDKVS